MDKLLNHQAFQQIYFVLFLLSLLSYFSNECPYLTFQMSKNCQDHKLFFFPPIKGNLS